MDTVGSKSLLYTLCLNIFDLINTCTYSHCMDTFLLFEFQNLFQHRISNRNKLSIFFNIIFFVSTFQIFFNPVWCLDILYSFSDDNVFKGSNNTFFQTPLCCIIIDTFKMIIDRFVAIGGCSCKSNMQKTSIVTERFI